jgi:hypothetical protein
LNTLAGLALCGSRFSFCVPARFTARLTVRSPALAENALETRVASVRLSIDAGQYPCELDRAVTKARDR